MFVLRGKRTIASNRKLGENLKEEDKHQEKRLQQSILPFAIFTPSRLQIREQIIGGVPPSIAGGQNYEAQERRHMESVLMNEKLLFVMVYG